MKKSFCRKCCYMNVYLCNSYKVQYLTFKDLELYKISSLKYVLAFEIALFHVIEMGSLHRFEMSPWSLKKMEDDKSKSLLKYFKLVF